MEKFTIHNIHKLEDYLEETATDWIAEAIIDHFGVAIEELSQEQIKEVEEFCEEAVENDYGFGLVGNGLRLVITRWEESQGQDNED